MHKHSAVFASVYRRYLIVLAAILATIRYVLREVEGDVMTPEAAVA